MDFNPNIPIYTQITETIKLMIAKGELSCGEKIKPVREFALEMQVNPNTMQKALSTLETEGLLYTERTSGRFVTNNNELIERLRKDMVTSIILQFFQAMKQMGFSEEAALEIINQYKGEK